MTSKFNIGDHVRWNSEAGHVSGKIIKVHTSDFDYKGHTHRASKDDPQYEIKSDKTDHIAAHKGSALHKIDSGTSEQAVVGKRRAQSLCSSLRPLDTRCARPFGGRPSGVLRPSPCPAFAGMTRLDAPQRVQAFPRSVLR